MNVPGLIVRNLTRNRRRAALTILGVAIGVIAAGLVFLVVMAAAVWARTYLIGALARGGSRRPIRRRRARHSSIPTAPNAIPATSARNATRARYRLLDPYAGEMKRIEESAPSANRVPAAAYWMKNPVRHSMPPPNRF